MPDYLNMDSALPIVKEGFQKKLTIAVSQAEIQANADKIWFWEYVRRVMNIDVEITQTMNSIEYKQLAFASGTLPDILFNLGLSTTEQMTYGVAEKMLLTLDSYITAEITPNLYAIYQANPQYSDVVRATDGHIYSLGRIGEANNEGAIPRLFYNTRWLTESSLEMPATVEQLLDVLRVFKSRGDDVVPMAGGYNAINPSMAILSAYGYITNDAKGMAVCMRDGKVVFPYGDKEAYGAYLKTMNQLYAENLISRDFYTIDAATVRATIVEDLTGLIAEPAFLSVPKTYQDWWAMKPLTSDISSKPVWYSDQSYINSGVFAVSASCKHPELAMRFADFFFDEKNSVLAYYGPSTDDSELFFDMVSGWYYDDDKKIARFVDVENDSAGLYGSVYLYRAKKIGALPSVVFGSTVMPARFDMRGAKFYLDQPYDSKIVFNLNDPDQHYRASVAENLLPHTQTGYPIHIFFTDETTKAITDLKSVLESHVAAETAKFVTGARALAELDQYFNELDALGYQAYLGYYVDYYESKK